MSHGFGFGTHIWGPGFRPDPPKKEVVSLKTGNTGYLWGLNADEPTIVGPANKWHFVATPGQAVPFWSLFNGTKEIGLSAYPTHEAYDWPLLLSKMLEGLNK